MRTKYLFDRSLLILMTKNASGLYFEQYLICYCVMLFPLISLILYDYCFAEQRKSYSHYEGKIIITTCQCFWQGPRVNVHISRLPHSLMYKSNFTLLYFLHHCAALIALFVKSLTPYFVPFYYSTDWRNWIRDAIVGKYNVWPYST